MIKCPVYYYTYYHFNHGNFDYHVDDFMILYLFSLIYVTLIFVIVSTFFIIKIITVINGIFNLISKKHCIYSGGA